MLRPLRTWQRNNGGGHTEAFLAGSILLLRRTMKWDSVSSLLARVVDWKAGTDSVSGRWRWRTARHGRRCHVEGIAAGQDEALDGSILV